MISFIGYITELDDEVIKVVDIYMKKHNNAKDIGFKHLFDVEAQRDALNLVGDLADIYKKYNINKTNDKF